MFLSTKADVGLSLFLLVCPWCGMWMSVPRVGSLFSFPASLSHDNAKESACERCKVT